MKVYYRIWEFIMKVYYRIWEFMLVHFSFLRIYIWIIFMICYYFLFFLSFLFTKEIPAEYRVIILFCFFFICVAIMWLCNNLWSNIKRINNNINIIDTYYNNHYTFESIENDGRYYYESYKFEKYRGYGVEFDDISNNIKLEDKKEWDDNYNRAAYEVGIPLHIELINKIKLNNNKKKYEFLYVRFESYSYIGTSLECDFLLNNNEGVNFMYVYDTMVFNKVGKHTATIKEYLINIDKKKRIDWEIKFNDLYKDIKGKYCVIANELDFFNRNALYEKYSYKNNILSHMKHSFFVYKLNKDLEDYYVIGNYIMKCNQNNVESLMISYLNLKLKIYYEKKYNVEYDIENEICIFKN
jgi:hypothetical protein